MRKTIYTTNGNGAQDRTFKLQDYITEVYYKQYKKNAPDMYVGIQTIAERGSENNWILTVDSSPEDLDKVENIAKLVKL